MLVPTYEATKTMSERKPDENDGLSSDDDSAKVPVRVIKKALEAITKQNVIITKIAIGLKKIKKKKLMRYLVNIANYWNESNRLTEPHLSNQTESKSKMRMKSQMVINIKNYLTLMIRFSGEGCILDVNFIPVYPSDN